MTDYEAVCKLISGSVCPLYTNKISPCIRVECPKKLIRCYESRVWGNRIRSVLAE